MCGFIAQLVEHRTGIAEVRFSNHVEALNFFRLLLSDCLNWKIDCDDHSLLTFVFVSGILEACSYNIRTNFTRVGVITVIVLNFRRYLSHELKVVKLPTHFSAFGINFDNF